MLQKISFDCVSLLLKKLTFWQDCHLASMTLKRSVAIELRLRAEAEARKEAAQKLKLIVMRFVTGTLTLVTILALIAFDVFAIAEPVIEEVKGAANFEKLLEEKDFVAVLWTARNCR